MLAREQQDLNASRANEEGTFDDQPSSNIRVTGDFIGVVQTTIVEVSGGDKQPDDTASQVNGDRAEITKRMCF